MRARADASNYRRRLFGSNGCSLCFRYRSRSQDINLGLARRFGRTTTPLVFSLYIYIYPLHLSIAPLPAARITRDRPKLLCRVYAYLTLIPFRPDWINRACERGKRIVRVWFLNLGRDRRIGAVHVSPLPLLRDTTSTSSNIYQVQSMEFTLQLLQHARALSCTATRARCNTTG